MAALKTIRFLVFPVFFLMMYMGAASCRHSSTSERDGCNSIYFWKTSFSLNDYEKEFLNKHNIKKLYIRFFDVDMDWESTGRDNIAPKATIQFKDTVPSGIEVVPTVYITNSAIEAMQNMEEEFAGRIFKRVNAMCRRNGIELIELQLDCDWTKHTQKYFFKLCDELKQLMDSTQALSSTIRLHQLTQAPPPVDKGVLMVYNTGNLMEMTTDNSIFSLKDIKPYLRDDRLPNYQLPLDIAYPSYGWSLVFHPGNAGYQFDRIMRRTDFSSYPQLKRIGNNTYEATEDIDFSTDSTDWDKVYEDYLIRVERPTAKEILEVKKIIDRQLTDKPHNIILYHLDESQLSHYSDYEINKIYSRD